MPCKLYFGNRKRLKPNFSASPIRCSILFTGRISPESPISPAIQTSGSIAASIFEEKNGADNRQVDSRVVHFQSAGDIQEYVFCASLKPTLFENSEKHIHSSQIETGCRTLGISINGGTNQGLCLNQERAYPFNGRSDGYSAHSPRGLGLAIIPKDCLLVATRPAAFHKCPIRPYCRNGS